MTSNEEKKIDESFEEFLDEETSSSCRCTPPNDQGNRFSDRLESLLTFLDEKENIDIASVESFCCRRYSTGSDSIGVHRGLVDTSNSTDQTSHQSTAERIVGQDEKAFKNKPGTNDGERSTHSLAFLRQSTGSSGKNKKYIWDEWEETCDGKSDLVRDMPLDDGVPDDHTKYEMSTGDNETESLSAARRQLFNLKAMGEEIHARTASLKSDLEKAKAEVESLHCIRIQNEADHVKAMKSLKRKWKERTSEVETKYDEASPTATAKTLFSLFQCLTISLLYTKYTIVDEGTRTCEM